MTRLGRPLRQQSPPEGTESTLTVNETEEVAAGSRFYD